MRSGRGILLALALSTAHVVAQTPYQPKGWVWYDNQDGTDAAWHLGAADKRKHAAAGLLIGSWVSLYCRNNGIAPVASFWWGLAVSIAVGYLKEIYDIRHGSGTGEIADILSTGLGGYAGASIVLPVVVIKW